MAKQKRKMLKRLNARRAAHSANKRAGGGFVLPGSQNSHKSFPSKKYR